MSDQPISESQLERLRRISQAYGALDRASARLEAADRTGLFAPLTEFCWWVIALDEELKRIGGASYEKTRDADPDGQIDAGLRYVRNALGHHLLTVTWRGGGLRLPFRLPMSIRPGVTRWKDAEDIPPLSTPQPWNRTVYADWVAGRDLEESRVAAHRWNSRQFDRLKADRTWARPDDG